MKFLCVPCDSPMKLQTVGPPERGSLSVVYACPECGYEMAMLTNAYETQVVQSLGVRIHRLRWIALVVASLMTASVVAISGPIGFVGLICPHLSRLAVGNDQRRLLIVATSAGAALLALADAASRLLAQPRFAGTLLPVGILTALMGGPFFLLLLWQNRRRMMLAEAGQ